MRGEQARRYLGYLAALSTAGAGLSGVVGAPAAVAGTETAAATPDRVVVSPHAQSVLATYYTPDCDEWGDSWGESWGESWGDSWGECMDGASPDKSATDASLADILARS